MGFVLAYPMENEMPFVNHTLEWWGCDYIDKDDKGLSERILKYLMLKPKSKLMQMEWE
jgi:hypothetical protein